MSYAMCGDNYELTYIVLGGSLISFLRFLIDFMVDVLRFGK